MSNCETKIFGPESLYCPVCGDNTYQKLTDDEETCEHLAYVYFPDDDEFTQVHSSLEAAVKEVYIEAQENFELFQNLPLSQASAEEIKAAWKPLEHPIVRLKEKLGEMPVFHMRIEEHGMACGPVFFELWAGYLFEEE